MEDHELQRLGLKRRIALRCQHYYAACQVVAVTSLLLTMPGHYASVLNRQSLNRLLPLPIAIPEMHMHLYWHERQENDLAHAWLRQQITEVVQVQELVPELQCIGG